MSAIQIAFDDAYLEGTGETYVEDGRLALDGQSAIERGNVLHVHLDSGTLFCGLTDGSHDRVLELEPGDYLVCRSGLYARVLVESPV